MTSYNKSVVITNFKAGADLSAAGSLYKAVKFDGSGNVVFCGAGEIAIGFLANAPKSDEVVEIMSIKGFALGISAATIAAGVLVKSDANGKLVAAVATDNAIALTMKSSVANDIVEIMPVLTKA
jgi:hypothetical protein